MSQLLERMLADGSIRPQGVIHLGAEWCQEAAEYDRCGARFVLWAEASRENHVKCLEELSRYPNQFLVDKAVWSKSGEVLTFNIYNARSSNSLFTNQDMQVWYPNHYVERQERVQTVSLDDMMSRYWRAGVEPNLLAMDLQGAELEALKGGSSLLSNDNLTWIVTEAMTEPLYRGQALLGDIQDHLANYGFRLVEQQRHQVSIWYPHIKSAIEEGSLDDVPQFDCLFTRSARD